MTARRPARLRQGRRLLFAGLALGWLALAAAARPADAAAAAPPRAPATRAVASHAPLWASLRERFVAARAERRLARWQGSLAGIVVALRREADAESSYLGSLAAWVASGAEPDAPRSALRLAALDALEAGRAPLGHALLAGPLRDDALLLPLRAYDCGARGAPDSGLALLGWPPDRRAARQAVRARSGGTGAEDAGEAALFVADALAESAGNRRAARAALWTLLASERSPAARREARLRLARSLLATGMPRLALTVIRPEEETGADAALVAADARAAFGDTLQAATGLAALAVPRGLPTGDRHALAMRAAAWLRGARADSVAEGDWLGLAGVLGDLGEPETGLVLFGARRRNPPDSAGAVARVETNAALLARAKRHEEAAALYARLLARGDLPAADRARFALGLGRAWRGAGRFGAMDSAFTTAVALDPGGNAGDLAAWERAREWEDRKPPREAAERYAWARSSVKSPTLSTGIRVHGGLAWLRAGSPDSARAFLAAPGRGSGETQFWLGRIASAEGDTAVAHEAFRAAWRLAPWSYEGIRAAEELRAAGLWPGDSIPFRADPPERVSRDSGLEAPLRVRLLEAVDLLPLALESLRECARSGGPEDRVCLDALEEHGVFRSARPARGGVDRTRWDYPPAYALEVFTAAERESLDPGFLWAIMRQESAYDRGVRSRAGALGLLQLLPSTASGLAGHAITPDSLFRADVNVRLAARYVRALTAELKDPRAIFAAYNAGEDAVRRWLREGSAVDDEWVERIPYRETRDYVKQVYSNWRRYEALYEPGDRPPAP